MLKLDANGDTVWVKTYWGGREEDDRASCVRQTTDGGYIVVGDIYYSESGNSALFLLKTDAQGNASWNKIYEGGGGYFVEQTTDGGYIITGYKGDYWSSGSEGLWLLRMNPSGDTLWTKVYGNEGEQGRTVRKTKDGGYVISGENEVGFWLLKVDNDGDTIWTRSYGSVDADRCRYAEQTTDGGYIIGGQYSAYTEFNKPWVIKTNPSGDSLWSRFIGQSYDRLYGMNQTSDGSYIVTGATINFDDDYHDYDLWLVKLDGEANKLWSRQYGGTADDRGFCVQETSDEGYIVCGETETFGNGRNFWLVLKTDSEGRIPIEISPTSSRDIGREVYPRKRFTPNGYFYNLGTYNYPYDFYCHCEITGIDNHNADYHDSVLVNGIDPFERVVIDFAEWKTIYSSTYEITYYATPATGPDFPSRPMSGYFYWDAIEEQPVAESAFEFLSTLGNHVVIHYTDFPQGFSAIVFDASGRKVDEIHSIDQSGTIQWGEGQSPGVYFVREESGITSPQKVILLR